ncbi:MAG: histidinol-phosphate transaminase [Pseudomonadota bacterium]
MPTSESKTDTIESVDTASRRTLLKLAGIGALSAGALMSSNRLRASASPDMPDDLAIMSANENPYGPSPKAVAAMRAELGNIYRYTWPLQMKFKEKIAARENVSPEQVLVANGSSPILAAFSEWVKNQDGKLLTSSITYEGVPRVSKAYGTEILFMPLSQDMGYDMEAISARISDDIGAVYLCNPNNPTGKTIDANVLRNFVDDASQKVPVFVDEAYLDMADDFPAGVMTEFVSAGRPVVIARTFSKLYAMAGQRLGYGIMPESMVADMQTTGRFTSVNHLALVAGIASLDDTAYFEEMRMKTALGRAKLVAMAADLNRPIAPDPQGSFIYMDTGMPNGEFQAKMLERGVRVVGERWQELPTWTRICVGLDHEIERCHEAAKQVLASA